ncbi:hypothetical protein [Thalassospira xiamenensis]|uniref:hypothetical protein n=1 Tax=Thalassospira xiamenensis TaxID=220697 RepID=UPI003AA7C09B
MATIAPTCEFRYRRGEGDGVEMPTEGKFLEIGKGSILSFRTSLAEATLLIEELGRPRSPALPNRLITS